jgi:hypothetical protein
MRTRARPALSKSGKSAVIAATIDYVRMLAVLSRVPVYCAFETLVIADLVRQPLTGRIAFAVENVVDRANENRPDRPGVSSAGARAESLLRDSPGKTRHGT